MNRVEYLLDCLAEEAVEVAQRATKANRFGLKEIQPGQNELNADRILFEYADLQAILEMLEEAGAIKPFPESLNRTLIRSKKKKVETFMEYSRRLGTLQGDIEKGG